MATNVVNKLSQLQSCKCSRPSTPGDHPPPPPSPAQITFLKLSRRAIAVTAPTVPLLLHLSSSHAQENTVQEATPSTTNNEYCTNNFTVTTKAFFDVSIGGEPAGRVTVGLFGDDVPLGSYRFLSLVTGKAGIGYRRKEFIKIMPNYVQHGGIISYDANPAITDRLVEELEAINGKCGAGRTMNVARSVSVVVLDPSRPPPKPKLVARKGKLEIDQEKVGIEPNATEFVIATKDAPELDQSSLVVGRVVDGMDVVEKIAQVATVKENSASPYFR